jgi:tetratricopeptide (TPR) repeat protein
MLAGGLMVLAVGCDRSQPLSFQMAILPPQSLQILAHPGFLVRPQTAADYRQQGLAFRQAGQMDAAIATLKIAVALDPTNPEGYVLLGWTQHLAGNQSLAAQPLQTLLEQTPDYVPALNALGIVYLVSGDLEAAVATHNRALEINPDNEIAHYNLSLAHQRLNDPEAAIAHAQTATQLEPQNPHPWVALALGYWSQGYPAKATTAYRQALALDSRYRQPGFLAHLAQAGFSPEQIQLTETIRQASV